MVDDEDRKAGTAAPQAVNGTYDAGDLGCGELLIELRRRILALPPGGVLEVTARDPAAPLDIPVAITVNKNGAPGSDPVISP